MRLQAQPVRPVGCFLRPLVNETLGHMCSYKRRREALDCMNAARHHNLHSAALAITDIQLTYMHATMHQVRQL